MFVSGIICDLLSHHHRNVPTWSDTHQQQNTTNYSNSKTECTERRIQQTYFKRNIEQARPMGVSDVPAQGAKSSFNHKIDRCHSWLIFKIILSQLAQVRCDVNRGSPAYSISAYTPSTLYIYSVGVPFKILAGLSLFAKCTCINVFCWGGSCLSMYMYSKGWACRESAT